MTHVGHGKNQTCRYEASTTAPLLFLGYINRCIANRMLSRLHGVWMNWMCRTVRTATVTLGGRQSAAVIKRQVLAVVGHTWRVFSALSRNPRSTYRVLTRSRSSRHRRRVRLESTYIDLTSLVAAASSCSVLMVMTSVSTVSPSRCRSPTSPGASTGSFTL